MIREPVLSDPYNAGREKEPDKKLMRLMCHNFKTAGCDLAIFGHGGFFCLDWNRWDGLPLDGVVILRTVFVMPQRRSMGCQRAIIRTVESMAHKTGCAVLAVAKTFEMKDPIETEEDFIHSYCCDWRDPLEYFGPDDTANKRQNAVFRRPAWDGSPVWVNLDISPNISTWWIKPEHCWIHIPETASPGLIQKLKPRLVDPASALG